MQAFRNYSFRAVSANSAGSVRDNGLFLSPAFAGAAEHAEGIARNKVQGTRNKDKGRRTGEKTGTRRKVQG